MRRSPCSALARDPRPVLRRAPRAPARAGGGRQDPRRPGATDALSARLIEAHGFECVYIGSYATAASRFGLPDTGLLSLDELAAQARTIANAVAVPVIADAEGGFHDPASIWRTVQAFEQAGVCAIHIEDHAGFGKHTGLPQTLRPLEDTAARVAPSVTNWSPVAIMARCRRNLSSRPTPTCGTPRSTARSW